MPVQQADGPTNFRHTAHARRPRARRTVGVVVVAAAAASTDPARPEQRPEVGPGRAKAARGALQQPLLKVLANGRLQRLTGAAAGRIS